MNVPANRNNEVPVTKDKQAVRVLGEMSNYKGKLDIRGAKPYLVNMGGKPYMSKGGLSLKLQEIANKRGGIKSVLSVPISYAHEGPEDMQNFLKLPEQMLNKLLEERGYEMAAFTTPKGIALNKCVIIFGNGLKVSEVATASKQNVKMSTIHEFLDVMAATRAYNRCIKKLTAEGFMSTDLIDEEYSYSEEDFKDEEDAPFRDETGAQETERMGAKSEHAGREKEEDRKRKAYRQSNGDVGQGVEQEEVIDGQTSLWEEDK